MQGQEVEQSAPVRAAIDIGSNTVHIVVARCMPDKLDILADEVDMTRIGESVNATGEISQQKQNETMAVLRKYKALAQQHHAVQILVVATEAIRKAKNKDEFITAMERETGLHVQMVSGDVEAVLTFYGATYELYQETQPPAKVGVMDLGGGSTELIVAKDKHITWRTSIPVGSGWLHDHYLSTNPPAHTDLVDAQQFLHTYLKRLNLKRMPSVLVATGGTANSLLLLARKAFQLPEQENQLTYSDVLRAEGLMSALMAEEIAQRYDQPVGRARILLAGTLIIAGVMTQFRLKSIRVCPHGIREGALLARTRYGEGWLQQVEEISKQTSGTGKGKPRDGEPSESFEHSGKRILKDRVDKFLDECDKVLHNESNDIEPVHKLRVASRRLRAALDAYQSCCDPRLFKKVYKRVKEGADKAGAVRDTDVMLQGLHAQLENGPDGEVAGVHWLIDHLKLYREKQQQALDDYLKTLDGTALKHDVEACITKGAVSSG
ncbi:MAG TPA: CHAD domain-containing protein [Ktedonobacteraceae bacterium]|nr:CHAD domain-containing protein [Ktedonobacteraceae bacterium]